MSDLIEIFIDRNESDAFFAKIPYQYLNSPSPELCKLR